MDEQFHEWGKVKWLWLSALLLSEAAGLTLGGRQGGLQVALLIGGGVLLLFLLVFGAYYFWRRTRARTRRQVFSTVIQNQATMAPRSVNDPNQRAALDRLRQKFQSGLNEFTSRGRDIYKLPWYLIIGEPGSGKSEAIRHSGIDFPPGMQNELQGSGGTVNMDWWFTNHGVMLDTAGRLLFGETPAGQAPEWTEFLKLLKKARSHCPINGLFIVLSVESLIKDSAERIAQKASRMAQQLDLIQRTLDVRFPVYLLVSKCDLLTGFRDFFESVEDPLLQHQIFGWSNPDPLDAPFRPDLVDDHLRSVVHRIQRRRLWLLRESFVRRLGSVNAAFRSSYSVGLPESTQRRAEEAETLFALPESVQRLAPRLRRYLETIFVSGEWSAKPVFLRGIFFTSSMREGKALDEAIAFATGLPLDQLPEDGDWEKDRAFFLRDLFLEKVFRESGLVTTSTNTLKLLRSRLFTVYGTSALAILLFVALTVFGFQGLNDSVRREAEFWKYGAAHWDAWAPGIVAGPDDQWQFRYTGNELVECRVPFLEQKPGLVEFHRLLQARGEQPLATSWLFKPLAWLPVRGEHNRQAAQRVLFEQWILKPLLTQTRLKMARPNSLASDVRAVTRQRDAWLALLQLEVDGATRKAGGKAPSDSAALERYLTAFLSYLTGLELRPEPDLLAIMARSYGTGAGSSEWPSDDLLAGENLASNPALDIGLAELQAATLQAQTNVFKQLATLDGLIDGLVGFAREEEAWLNNANATCQDLNRNLSPLLADLSTRWEQVRTAGLIPTGSLTNLGACYDAIEGAASQASALALLARVDRAKADSNSRETAAGLLQEIRSRLEISVSHAASVIQTSRRTRAQSLAALERDALALVNGKPAFEARGRFYTGTCALEGNGMSMTMTDIGKQWARLSDWKETAVQLRSSLRQYDGPLAEAVARTCNRLIAAADERKGRETIAEYIQIAQARLADLTNGVRSLEDVTRAQDCFVGLENDLGAATRNRTLGEFDRPLASFRERLPGVKRSVIAATSQYLQAELGFPILAGSSLSLTADGLMKWRQLIDQLASRFTNTVWASSRETATELGRLRSNLASYQQLAGCLLDSAGRITQVRLTVFPWEQLASQDKEVVRTLRYLQIPGFVPEADLTQATALATLPIDQEVSIYFRKASGSRDPVTVLKRPRWWILQSICSGEAVPLEGGTENWRLRIPLADPEQKLKGHVVLDVQFPSGTRLPRREDWPK